MGGTPRDASQGWVRGASAGVARNVPLRVFRPPFQSGARDRARTRGRSRRDARPRAVRGGLTHRTSPTADLKPSTAALLRPQRGRSRHLGSRGASAMATERRGRAVAATLLAAHLLLLSQLVVASPVFAFNATVPLIMTRVGARRERGPLCASVRPRRAGRSGRETARTRKPARRCESRQTRENRGAAVLQAHLGARRLSRRG